jgi:hypothetical protein
MRKEHSAEKPAAVAAISVGRLEAMRNSRLMRPGAARGHEALASDKNVAGAALAGGQTAIAAEKAQR